MQTVDHTINIIEISHISFAYQKPEYAVRNISFNVHKGDYLGIIGPNGGGKTTVLKIMLGLLKPMEGHVKLFGQEINNFKDWYKIGYVPQKATSIDANFPVTVEEVVSMGVHGKRNRKNVDTALCEVDMLSYKKKRIGELSGGLQQRVFIARALVSQPEVIFLDEPTVGVDSKTQELFYLLLRKLNKELDLTLILVSHELDIVARETTEVAFINHTLVSYCTPDELTKSGTLEHLYGKDLKYIVHDHGGVR